jgi:hypothetical protein
MVLATKKCRDCINMKRLVIDESQSTTIIGPDGKHAIQQVEPGEELYYCALGYWKGLARPADIVPAWLPRGRRFRSVFIEHADLCMDFDSDFDPKGCHFYPSDQPQCTNESKMGTFDGQIYCRPHVQLLEKYAKDARQSRS